MCPRCSGRAERGPGDEVRDLVGLRFEDRPVVQEGEDVPGNVLYLGHGRQELADGVLRHLGDQLAGGDAAVGVRRVGATASGVSEGRAISSRTHSMR